MDWGPPQAGALHPGEWTWQVIHELSLANPTYPGVWTQAFFSLAALVKAVLSSLAGGVQLLLGNVQSAEDAGISARLAGRLTVALLGSGQIVLTYLVGRRYFDSPATGLLAAALVACSPLLVAYSHYLSLDIPLGFAILGCLWAAWLMVHRPGWSSMAAAGLIFGLTITTKASGVLALTLFIPAFFLAGEAAKPSKSRFWGGWAAAFFGGALTGLILGYPGFVIHAHQTGQVLADSLEFPSGPAFSWGANALVRLRNIFLGLSAALGPVLIPLWMAGALLVLRRRLWLRVLPLIMTLMMIVAGAGLLKGTPSSLAAVWLPAAAITAVWPLVYVCRRIQNWSRSVWAVTVLGVVVCVWPFWLSLGVGYLFWQEGTLTTARKWVKDNLPPGAALVTGQRVPAGVFAGARNWDGGKALDGMIENGGYLITSAAEGYDVGPGRPAGVPSGEEGPHTRFSGRFQLLKHFSIKQAWRFTWWGKEPGFLDWLSPPLQIYAAQSPLLLRQQLALWRPGAAPKRASALVAGDFGVYSRSLGISRIGKNRHGERVLVLRQRVEDLGLSLRNLGDDLCRVKIWQDPMNQRRLSIYPGQRVDLLLSPLPWPPMMRGVYPVKISLQRGDLLQTRLSWEPLLVGRHALEAGRDRVAVEVLDRLVRERGPGFEALAMLAQACVRLGDLKGAARALSVLGGGGSAAAKRYQALAKADVADEAWDREFRSFTGIDPPLLRQSTSVTYLLQIPSFLNTGKETIFSGTGYHGVLKKKTGDKGMVIHLWLDHPLPTGPLRASLSLFSRGYRAAQATAATLEIWRHGPEGSQVLAQREIKTADLKRRFIEVGLNNASLGARAEVRLHLPPGREALLTRLTVGVDLRGHMASMLRWYLDAAGRVALVEGRYPQATAIFQELIGLDPGYEAAYLPLTAALIDLGKLEEAYTQARRAEKIFISRPDRLSQVKDLYTKLGRKEDLQRVDKRLGDLRPSLGREVVFQGGMTLVGFDLAAAKARPGDGLAISYYWRCRQPTPLNYFISVHLRGQGRLITFDHLLDHGRADMTRLKKGQVVREDYSLSLPPDLKPGKYHLEVGLWDPHFTGKGVKITKGVSQRKDRVELAVIEIKPPGTKISPAS